MSKDLTRGIALFPLALWTFCLFAFGANPDAQNAPEKVQIKTYSIERLPAEEIRERLENLMPDELKRFTFLFVNPQRNEVIVQGPLAAIEMADQCIPRMQEIKMDTTYGTLSPINTFTKARNPEPIVLSNNPRENYNAPLVCGEVYRCAVRDVDAFERELTRLFGQNPAISFLFTEDVESRTLNVSVFAPEDVQAQFGDTLRGMGVLLPEIPKENENQSTEGEITTTQYLPSDFAIVSHSYLPKISSVGKIDLTLRSALGKRFVRTDSQNPDGKQATGTAKYEYVITTGPRRRSLQVELNYDRREILLNGDKKLCEQMLMLIGMIDRPKVAEGMDRKIFTISGKQSQHIRKFANALALQPPVPQPPVSQQPVLRNYQSQPVQYPSTNSNYPSAPVPQFQQNSNATPETRTRFAPNSPVRQVTYKPQQESTVEGLDLGIGGAGDFPGGIPTPYLGNDTGMGMPYGPMPGYSQENGPVFEMPQALNIIPLPELDIILFEGTTGDSKRLQEMIRDIEKMMADSQSEMKVVYLKNTDCVSMNEMLYDMNYLLLFSRKQGQFNLFPLRNPNALMVVGWGTAYNDMLKLIETLDTPISEPGSCWKAIRLKYVSATYASTLITQLFPTPTPTPTAPLGQHVYGKAWMPRIRAIAEIRTNSLLVHAGPNDLKEVEQLLRKIDLHESGPQMLIRNYRLKNSVAADVATKLTAILSPGTAGIGVTADQKFPTFVVETLDAGERRLIESGIVSDFKINPDPQQNMLYVTAPEYAHELIGKLIEMLDTRTPTASMRMIPLVNGDADEILKILNNLIPSQILGRQAIGQQMPGSKGEEDFVPLRFANDVRSNTIIAVGSKGDLDAVEAIVLKLDLDDTEKRIRQVYTLKNAQATDVAAAISLYVTQKQNIIRQTPGGVSAALQIEEAFIVVAEKDTNSLVIEASPKYFEEVLKMIEDLDKQPDQVMIKVLIAEVTCSNTDEFGAEFGIQDSILFNRSTFANSYNSTRTVERVRPDGSKVTITEPVYVPAGTGVPGFNFGDPRQQLGSNLNSLSAGTVGTVAPQMLTNFNTGRTSSESGFGGMVFSASSDSVSILIRALEETRRLEVLSRPSIMAMDNQMAFILVGERVPFVSGGNSSYGNYSSDVKMEEVGLMLMVTPRISPDGKVVMDIGAEKSSVGSLADGIPIPDGAGGSVNSPKISAITTKTNISASDKETVMLAGMLTKETQNINRRVPFLSDIPVLGRLFQYKLDTVQKKELIIIMTPEIVRHRKGEVYSQDAERIKREEVAKIHWCLNDVMKLHGSPNNSNSLRVWEPMAEQPVAGDAEPLYPTVPVPLNNLQIMTPENNSPTPAPILVPRNLSRPGESPIPDRLFPESNIPELD